MVQESRHQRPMKPFGWGDQNVYFEAIAQKQVQKFLKEKFDTDVIYPKPRSFDLEAVKVQQTPVPEEVLREFRSLLGEGNLTTGKRERALFSGGRSFRDLMRMRSLQVSEAPDLVFFPGNKEQLQRLMPLAATHRVALIPFAGGTSVVGGLDPCKGAHRYTAAVDMTRLNRVLHWDEESQLVTAEAGIYGVDLEAYLNQRGYTLGHFPQSFEYTTLGGWVSARSSGQNSILYGSIDKLVFALKMLTPDGAISTPEAPNYACGPDIKQVIVGSEGMWGFVYSCTLKVQRLPETKVYDTYIFKTFEDAADVARRIAQSEARPAMVRVSDEAETESLLALSASTAIEKSWLHRLKGLGRSMVMTRWRHEGFPLPRVALMTVGLEGTQTFTAFNRQLIQDILSRSSYKNLGPGPGQRWLKDRFFLPYARDAFMDQNLLVDTFETATTWRNRRHLYHTVQRSIKDTCERQGVKFALFCHLSHIYSSGTSLYFTIICQQKTQALAQWEEIKTRVSAEIVAHGGVISHHHGVGTDHKSFLAWGPSERRLWQAVKATLDPHGIMNPGKLL